MTKEILIEKEYCVIKEICRGIGHVHYTTTELQLDDYLEIIEIAKQKRKEYGELYLLFTQVRHFSLETKTWDYAKKNASKFDFVDASAIVLIDLPTRLMILLYMTFNKNTIPTKIFSNKKDAMEWLELKKKEKQQLMDS